MWQFSIDIHNWCVDSQLATFPHSFCFLWYVKIGFCATVHSRLYPLFIHHRKKQNLYVTEQIFLGYWGTFVYHWWLIILLLQQLQIFFFWFSVTFSIVSMKGIFIHQWCVQTETHCGHDSTSWFALCRRCCIDLNFDARIFWKEWFCAVFFTATTKNKKFLFLGHS